MPGKVYLLELEPCPFCGSSNVRTVSFGRSTGYVSCGDCRAMGPDEEEPYDLWNNAARVKEDENAA